jgi:hypothetical protein
VLCTKVYGRVICPMLGQLHDPRSRTPLAIAWQRFDRQVDALFTSLQLAA